MQQPPGLEALRDHYLLEKSLCIASAYPDQTDPGNNRYTALGKPELWLLAGVYNHSKPSQLGHKVPPRAFHWNQALLVTQLMVHFSSGFQGNRARKLIQGQLPWKEKGLAYLSEPVESCIIMAQFLTKAYSLFQFLLYSLLANNCLCKKIKSNNSSYILKGWIEAFLPMLGKVRHHWEVRVVSLWSFILIQRIGEFFFFLTQKPSDAINIVRLWSHCRVSF